MANIAGGDPSASIHRDIVTKIRGLVPRSLQGSLVRCKAETQMPSAITIHVQYSITTTNKLLADQPRTRQ